jgi:hypothetical protein
MVLAGWSEARAQESASEAASEKAEASATESASGTESADSATQSASATQKDSKKKPDAAESSQFFDMTLAELLRLDPDKGEGILRPLLYGYLRTNVERVLGVPSLDSVGQTQYSNDPLEWSAPAYHLFAEARIAQYIDVLFNLAGSGLGGIEVRNAYGNIRINDALQARFGVMYQRFGLYNEKLDQAPTFLGIEPPELFDQDHLMLPRTAIFALHGETQIAPGWQLMYMAMTDNAEAGALTDVYPLSWDLRVRGMDLVAGTSGYLSSITGVRGAPTVAVGNGPPRAGIVPWMSEDWYAVVGAFAEYRLKNLFVQSEYWYARHNAVRDPAAVLNIVQNAGISPSQRARFLGASAGLPDASLTPADVVTAVSYAVQTFYIRAGYTFVMPIGLLTPYAFFDWMSQPESIQNKDFGGDNEAGFADNGHFFKPSVGVVYKPVEPVAIKLDSSAHIQTFNGRTEIYPEFRLDVSFAFTLLD